MELPEPWDTHILAPGQGPFYYLEQGIDNIGGPPSAQKQAIHFRKKESLATFVPRFEPHLFLDALDDIRFG